VVDPAIRKEVNSVYGYLSELCCAYREVQLKWYSSVVAFSPQYWYYFNLMDALRTEIRRTLWAILGKSPDFSVSDLYDVE
jgi:hypothetical protein